MRLVQYRTFLASSRGYPYDEDAHDTVGGGVALALPGFVIR